MAGEFFQGVETAQKQNESNPFNVIFGRFQEAQVRRYKEDQQRRTEEAELSKALQVLNKDYLYKQELEKAKAEEERKNLLFKGQTEGRITETQETGEGTFEGTPFGAVGKRYKTRQGIDQQTKDIELKIKQKQLQQLEDEGQTTANEKDTFSKLGIPEDEK